MIGRSSLEVWRAIVAHGRCVSITEICADAAVQRSVERAKTPLSATLANLVTQGHLACDHAPFARRQWWFGVASRLPSGEAEVGRIVPEHVASSTASARDPDAWRRPAEQDRPVVLRRGALDCYQWPSRRGSRLYWPDGRVTTLDGAAVSVEIAT